MKNIINNKSALLFLFISLALIALLSPLQASAFLDAWINSHSYSHGPLILLTSFYLIATKPKSLMASSGSPLLMPALILLIFIGILADIAKIDVISRFLFPCYLLISFYIIFGYRNFINFAIPLLLLFFAVPSWSIISPIFQAIAATAVAFISSTIGIPTFIEGNYISIPNGTFLVAEGCSGVRYILVALAISLINSEISNHKLSDFLISLAVALSLAVVANWIRIQVIVLYAHIYGMDHPMIEDHNSLGWIIFAIIMVIYFYFIPKITRTVKVTSTTEKVQFSRQQIKLSLLIIFTFIVMHYLKVNFYNTTKAKIDSQASFYSFNHFTDIKQLTNDLSKVNQQASILFFDMRNSGADMTHAQNTPISSAVKVVESIPAPLAGIKSQIVDKNYQRYLYSYWYQVSDKRLTSLTKAKLYTLKAIIAGDFTNRAFFLATKCPKSNCNNIEQHNSYIKQVISENE